MQNYYIIKRKIINQSEAEFIVELQTDCPVYAGHFPGNPIAPGACNIEMVRECASIAIGKELRIVEMKVCKFLSLMQPQKQQELIIQLSWSDSNYSANILANENMVAQMKIIYK